MRASPRFRLPLLAAAALAAGAAVGGGTFALWSPADTADGGTITAGDLDVEAESTVWRETSEDVAAAPRVIDPDEFLVRPGDTVTAEFPVTVTLEGENMRAEIGAEWAGPPEVPAGVTGTYQLRDDDGDMVGEALDLEQDGTLLDAAEPSAGLETSYTLHVALDFSGLDDRFGEGSPTQTVDLDELQVTVDQIRSGGDFE